jgi:hypothetical protein
MLNTHASLREHNKSVLQSLEVGDLVEFPRGLFSHWGVSIGQYLLILCSLVHLDYNMYISYIYFIYRWHRYPLSLFSYIRLAKYTLKQVEIKLVNVIYTGCSKSKYRTTYWKPWRYLHIKQIKLQNLLCTRSTRLVWFYSSSSPKQ